MVRLIITKSHTHKPLRVTVVMLMASLPTSVPQRHVTKLLRTQAAECDRGPKASTWPQSATDSITNCKLLGGVGTREFTLSGAMVESALWLQGRPHEFQALCFLNHTFIFSSLFFITWIISLYCSNKQKKWIIIILFQIHMHIVYFTIITSFLNT